VKMDIGTTYILNTLAIMVFMFRPRLIRLEEFSWAFY